MTKIDDRQPRQDLESMLLTGGAAYRADLNSACPSLEITAPQLDDLRQEMLADRALKATKGEFPPHWYHTPIKALELSTRLHALVTTAPFLAETVGELIEHVSWPDLKLGASEQDAHERNQLKERLNRLGISLRGWSDAVAETRTETTSAK